MAQAPSAATNFLSPEDYELLLRQGQGQIAAGQQMAQAPRHWTQALASALSQGVGAYRQDMARDENRARQAAGTQALAALLRGDEGAFDAAMKIPGFENQAMQYELGRPQREASAFNLAQAKANAPLERQLMEAKIAQAQRRASGELAPNDLPMSVREWQYFSKLPPEQKDQYLTMKRAQQKLDLGTSIELRSGAAGAAPTTIQKDIAGVEEQKAIGKAQGEGRVGLAKAAGALEAGKISDENLFRSIDNAERLASPWTTGFVGSLSKFIAGSPSSDLAITLQQVKANMGFGALQQMRDNSPTGGALGNVTERELALLQNAEVALDQAQSLPEFRSALRRIREIKQQYAVLRQQAYQRDVKRFGAANVPSPNIEPEAAPEAEAPPPAGGRFDFGQGGMSAPSGFSIKRLD